MARIVFLQLNDYELHGPQAISAGLALKGHESSLIVPRLTRDPLGEMSLLRPQVVGIGHTTAEREEALIWARAIKARLGCLVALGGIDPTFRPELALEPGVDVVVRGEADHAMADLLDRVEEGADFSDLPNLAVAAAGTLKINPMGPSPADLDQLPFPDKDLYFRRYRHFRDYPIKFFMASRGCPHHCRYCANQGLKALCTEPEHYVRFKSPDYLLAEIKRTLSIHPARTIGFNDDLFAYRMEWLAEFLPRFRDEIGVPFFCNARIDTMTEEKAALLREGGCYTCWYGLESANPATREEVLGRRMSNDEIRRGVEVLHRHGILTQSYNMMNLPGENFQDGLATLKFNRELGNDFVVASLFQPFPGTQLFEKLAAAGRLQEPERLSGRRGISYFAFSPFVQEDTDKFSNLQKLFILGHRHPWLSPLVERACGLPPNPLFDILFLVSFALDYKRSHRLKLWEVVHFNLRHLWTTYIARSAALPEVI